MKGFIKMPSMHQVCWLCCPASLQVSGSGWTPAFWQAYAMQTLSLAGCQLTSFKLNLAKRFKGFFFVSNWVLFFLSLALTWKWSGIVIHCCVLMALQQIRPVQYNWFVAVRASLWLNQVFLPIPFLNRAHLIAYLFSSVEKQGKTENFWVTCQNIWE